MVNWLLVVEIEVNIFLRIYMEFYSFLVSKNRSNQIFDFWIYQNFKNPEEIERTFIFPCSHSCTKFKKNSNFSRILRKNSQSCSIKPKKVPKKVPKSIVSSLKSKLSGIPHKFFLRILNIPIRSIKHSSKKYSKKVPKSREYWFSISKIDRFLNKIQTKWNSSSILFKNINSFHFPNHSIKHSSKKDPQISK